MNDQFATRLECGMEVVGERLAGVQSAAFAFFVGAGAKDETEGRAGLAHLTESTLFRGTGNRSARQLTEELDRIGASRGSSSGIEFSVFSSVMLGDHIGAALDVFVDVLRNASFPADDFEAVRGLQVQEIGQRADQPAQLVMDEARRLFFAPSPLGNDTLGSAESVMAITREDAMTFWRSRFSPANMLMAVAGNIDETAILSTMNELCRGWVEGPPRTASVEAVPSPMVQVSRKAIDQENICFVFPGVSNDDRLYYACSLMASILGGGMNSRLTTEVREKRGLAYSVGARFDGMEKTGLVRIYVGTQPARARESVEVITAELVKLQKEGIAPAELELNKTRLNSRVVMASESTGNRTMQLARDWWFKRELRTLHNIRRQIDAVTTGDVRDLLDRIQIIENLGLVSLGPLSPEELGVSQGIRTRAKVTG